MYNKGVVKKRWGELPMYIHHTKPLFAWGCLEDSPSLRTVRQALAMLPDGKLLESLRGARGKGRDDYPVEALWGVVVLTVVLRHSGIEACLGELRRNAGLREAIGIESEAGVPKKWNVSRFLEVLGRDPHRTLLHEMFDAMVGGGSGGIDGRGRDGAQRPAPFGSGRAGGPWPTIRRRIPTTSTPS